ncbi:MAG TPA: dTDP-4-dehydrorhamnose 3,5-epimerase [Hyphomonadaceae bacterium]|nr:dTDP-4-dehydrorhamnose 3,5-epimerase [Hyphomonadaceae bacterium]
MGSELNVPRGVRTTKLAPNRDHRGTFTELFRREWVTGTDSIQWNVVTSHAGVLRGFHVHPQHTDYLAVVSGKMLLGLRDLRRKSPTFGLAGLYELDAERPAGWTIPPGVGHGFFFPVPTVTVYSVDRYWSKDDELACRWNDRDLGIDWPVKDPLLSPRDAAAGTLAQMIEDWERLSAADGK